MRTFARITLPAAICPAVFALSTFLARSARAEVAIAGDVDFASPIDSSYGSGAGFGLRVGYHAHVPLVTITPELGFSYYGLGGDESAKLYRGVGGIRLALFEIVRPGIFGHIGVGHLSADGPPPDPSHSALTYDAGVFLDFTLLPLLNIGAHGAYNRVDAENGLGAVQWMTVGAHAELVF